MWVFGTFLGSRMSFISKIPRSFRYGAKRRKLLQPFQPPPVLKSSPNSLAGTKASWGPTLPTLLSRLIFLHILPHAFLVHLCAGIMSFHICAGGPAVHPTSDSSLNSPPFRQFYLPLPFILWDWAQAPGQPSLNFQTGASNFGFYFPEFSLGTFTY